MCGTCNQKYRGMSIPQAKTVAAANSSTNNIPRHPNQCDFCKSSLETMTMGGFVISPRWASIDTVYGIRIACTSCAERIKKRDHVCFVCKKSASYECEHGVYLCETCRSNRMTPQKVDTMYPRILKEIEDVLKQKIPCKPRIIPCTYAEMQRDEDGDAIELGLFTCESEKLVDSSTGQIVSTKEACTIRFVRHLPHDVFQDVIAHEIAHHWLHHCVSGKRTLSEEEGFAEWVAFYIGKLHCIDGVVRGHTEKRDPIYGDGFRMIKQRIESGRYRTPALLFAQ